MKEYAAKYLGITVFNTETHEINIRSRKMLERIGFKEFSRILSEENYLGTESRSINTGLHKRESLVCLCKIASYAQAFGKYYFIL